MRTGLFFAGSAAEYTPRVHNGPDESKDPKHNLRNQPEEVLLARLLSMETSKHKDNVHNRSQFPAIKADILDEVTRRARVGQLKNPDAFQQFENGSLPGDRFISSDLR